MNTQAEALLQRQLQQRLLGKPNYATQEQCLPSRQVQIAKCFSKDKKLNGTRSGTETRYFQFSFKAHAYIPRNSDSHPSSQQTIVEGLNFPLEGEHKQKHKPAWTKKAGRFKTFLEFFVTQNSQCLGMCHACCCCNGLSLSWVIKIRWNQYDFIPGCGQCEKTAETCQQSSFLVVVSLVHQNLATNHLLMSGQGALMLFGTTLLNSIFLQRKSMPKMRQA